MPTTPLDLGKLVSPYDPETFLRDYWEQKPLVVARGLPDHYGALLSSADVDEVIAFTRPKFEDPREFSTERVRESSYVKGWPVDTPIAKSNPWASVSDVQSQYARGKTVVVMAMQERWRPIAALCRSLEAVFYCPVHANMYLTPEGAQGFDTHFDTHEVFVLQLEGVKHWRVYGSPRRLPLVDEHLNAPKEELGQPTEVRLEPGDLLYLPRGFVHEAFTSECASLHLTVGINVHRWVDLLHEAVAELAARDVRFRGSIPTETLRGSPAASCAELFRELAATVAADARFERAVNSLSHQFLAALKPVPGGAFARRRDEPEIRAETILERPPDRLCRVWSDGRWAEIVFPGGRVGGPAKIAPALHFIAGAVRFRAGSLPGELGSEGKLVLARRLVRERLLNVVDETTDGAPPAQLPSQEARLAES